MGSFHQQLNIPRRQEEQKIFASLRTVRVCTAHITISSSFNLTLAQNIHLYINLSLETQSNSRGIRLLSWLGLNKASLVITSQLLMT
jgi:hypothetical protein